MRVVCSLSSYKYSTTSCLSKKFSFMKYELTHNLTYTYSEPVSLYPHIVRLRPRSNGWQTLHQFCLQVVPEPMGRAEIQDLDGNAVVQIWFPQDQQVTQLQVKSTAQVETHCQNPFSYQLDSHALCLPFDYLTSLSSQLQPYLQTTEATIAQDATISQLAQQILVETDYNPLNFLSELNRRIYETCRYITRETGAPLPPSVTWARQQGSCRDVAVLFIAVCRAVGLAARFVSGYHEVDPGQQAYLHAWAEVYLPGAGWRGYDPTQGLAVADRHIALTAAPSQSQTLPLPGKIGNTHARSYLTYQITIDKQV